MWAVFSCSTRAPGRGGLALQSTALGRVDSAAVAPRRWSTGSVPVLYSTWDLSGLGIEPTSPMLPRGFFTTEPGWKPPAIIFLKKHIVCSFSLLSFWNSHNVCFGHLIVSHKSQSFYINIHSFCSFDSVISNDVSLSLLILSYACSCLQ